MKKHAQTDILQKVIRAVTIVNPPHPLFVHTEIKCVCLQVESVVEVPWQSRCEGVCVCVCDCVRGFLKYD